MELTFNYLFKAAITLFLLYLLYYGLLRNQLNFRFNRLYLLLAPLVAMLFPMMEWSASVSPETAVGELLQVIQLNEIIVTTSQPETQQGYASYLSFSTIALGLYAVGALLMLLKLIKQLWQVQQVKARAIAGQEINRKVQVYLLPDLHASFAFGNAIFLGKQGHVSPADHDKILEHELAHVQLYHSWDILYYELLTALLWFNPVIWLLKQELRDVHEYQADAKVLQKYAQTEYSALLSKEVLQHMGLPIGSYFQKPQVLKRLQMMQLNGQRSGWLRPLLILPALGALLLVFSLQAGAQVTEQKNTSTAVTEVSEKTTQVLTQDATVPDQAKEKLSRPETVSLQPISTEEEPKPVTTSTEIADSEQPVTRTENKPFVYVEQMPQFEDGDAELMKYLAVNIRYPEKAKQEGAEGMAVVGFIVNENGTLQDIHVIKSVEESIDAEAIRVVEQMDGKWIAGKQNGKPVRVKYTLPIRFVIK